MDDREFLKKIGIKLKVLRSLRGFSQDDIANRLDIDKSYYSKVERGLTNPTLLYLKNLSEVLEVRLDELVTTEIKL
ncbi:XRE family transcriptional regulator [Candidatus Gastranaerophilales bacterium]|nr:MAG: XRE family transcriptional regulator [Candidatus Gastranaerophilales bacterium]